MDTNAGFWELIWAEFALKTSLMLSKVPLGCILPLGLDLSTSP